MATIHTGYEEAARAGSRGGENSHRLINTNTTGRPAQLRSTPMPSQGATTERRAVQLRLFTPDRAVIESHTSSARSGNGAAAKAVTEDDVSGGAI